MAPGLRDQSSDHHDPRGALVTFPTQHPEARRNAYSDASARKGKRKDLLWDKRRFLQPAAENRLAWSEYDSSFWAVTGSSDAGKISLGPYADENLILWAQSYDSLGYGYSEITDYRGVQTWEYSSETTVLSDAIDLTSLTYPLCFSVVLGPHHSCSGESFSVVLAITNGAGTQTLGTKTFSGITGELPLWVSSTEESDDGYAKVSITLTYSGSETFKWFFWGAQLESARTIPGVPLRTRGGARVFATDQVLKCFARIFPDEHEFGPEPWEGRNIPREGRDRSSYVIPHAAHGREL